MDYFWAIFLPPVAAFRHGGTKQGLLNILLCCLVVLPGVIHAVMLVSDSRAERRHQEMVVAMAPTAEAAARAEATIPRKGLARAELKCRRCGKRTPHAKRVSGNGKGLTLSVLTAGLYLPVYLTQQLLNLVRPWKCQVCAQRTMRGE